MMGVSAKRYRHILWDWNGTLLDDVELVVRAMNNLLVRRSMPLIDEEKYRDIFTFPVAEYYASLGFDFDAEPFEKLAGEFVAEYGAYKNRYRLFTGAEEVLRTVKSMGIGQSILSASREKEIRDAVRLLKIGGYFEKIAGLADCCAASKVERGRALLSEIDIDPGDVLLVGDTAHDFEVSREIKCDCLLICNGHQSYRRISACSAGIVKTIRSAAGYIRGNIAV